MKYQTASNRIAAVDPAVHKVMMEVSHLFKPPSGFGEHGMAGRIAAEMRNAYQMNC
jgi:hypothetical protein